MTLPATSPQTSSILAADLGGTKTLLAACVVDGAGAPPRVVHERSFHSAAHGSLEEIVEAFVRELAPALAAPRAACFAVAGPVLGDRAEITNLPWTIEAAALSTLLGGAPVTLLNDLEATAIGMTVLPADAFATLQEGQLGHGAIAVLAPGTGFGQSLLVRCGGAVHAIPMEAGHADFAPTTDEEIELLRFLRVRHGGHVSYERVLSGDGLGDIYEHLRTKSALTAPAWLVERLAGPARNAEISRAGLEGTDATCVRALEMFVEILGNEAGNAALRGLARGGVILGGGIPPKILPALRAPSFLARFRDKGRFAGFLRTLSVRVAQEPRAALLGAAARAAA